MYLPYASNQCFNTSTENTTLKGGKSDTEKRNEGIAIQLGGEEDDITRVVTVWEMPRGRWFFVFYKKSYCIYWQGGETSNIF